MFWATIVSPATCGLAKDTKTTNDCGRCCFVYNMCVQCTRWDKCRGLSAARQPCSRCNTQYKGGVVCQKHILQNSTVAEARGQSSASRYGRHETGYRTQTTSVVARPPFRLKRLTADTPLRTVDKTPSVPLSIIDTPHRAPGDSTSKPTSCCVGGR